MFVTRFFPDVDTILTIFKRVIISMQDMATQRASLYKVWNFAMHGCPELVDTLLEAYHRGCPVADASLDLVALLAAGENRIDGHHNHNILTAEHVVSVLSGNAMTTTAIYRAI
jgi:Ser/Thr protein kinase RdoA (MazF antagonist)